MLACTTSHSSDLDAGRDVPALDAPRDVPRRDAADAAARPDAPSTDAAAPDTSWDAPWDGRDPLAIITVLSDEPCAEWAPPSHVGPPDDVPLEGVSQLFALRWDGVSGGMSVILPDGATVDEVVRGLRSVGVSARDIISILQAIKSAGAMNAELELQ